MSRCPARARDIVTGSRKRASQALRLGVLGTRQEKSDFGWGFGKAVSRLGKLRFLSDEKEELTKELKSGQS